jgi:poly-beta-1,6-N-acetyl-D-glucosamine synthase
MIFVVTLTSLYILLIGGFAIGVLRLKKAVAKNDKPKEVTVVCPFRNEEHHLLNLIKSLSLLNLKNIKIELIFVDDHSMDSSVHIIKNNMHLLSEFSVQLLSLSFSNEFGKKAAQRHGVLHSSHEIIVFTDADCLVPENWIDSLLSYKNDSANMVCGPVEYTYGGSWLKLAYSTEFMSLMLSGAGSFGIGMPIFCNGANMLIQKKAYLRSMNQIGGTNLASGDDVFLLHSIIKNSGSKSVRFAYTQDAVVQRQHLNLSKSFLYSEVVGLRKQVRTKITLQCMLPLLCY